MLKEVEYKDIFSPETLAALKGKSKDSLQQMIGDKNVMQIVRRTMSLLPEISAAEADYIDELEPLAIQMVKDAYPIIDYADIQIDAKITNMGEISNMLGEENPEEEEEAVSDLPEEKRRRIINGISQGASIRGGFWFLIFREYLDQLDPSLIEKYKEVMNLSLGAYDDDNFIALLLASLAAGQKTAGGASEVETSDDGESLKITAKALNFPMLVYEIVKGLYEIVSLQGFGPDKEQNKRIVKKVDKLTNEPDDLRYGKFIYDAISKLYNESNMDDPRIREYLFTELYKLPNEEFFPFVENAINNKLTPSQKKWVIDAMKDIASDLRQDDAGIEND